VAHDWLSVAFAHAGRHVVRLAVTDGAGEVGIAEQVVEVDGADRPRASLAPFGAAVAGAVAARPELLLLAAPHVPLRRHRLRVVVRCRRAPACRGTLRAVVLVGRQARPVLLPARPFRVTGGSPRVLHLRLSGLARRRLGRRARLQLTAYRGPVRVAGIWATHAYTLRLPRSHGRRDGHGGGVFDEFESAR
jgi:hypothetical protein